MNYSVEIKQPNGTIVFRGTIDITPFGLAMLEEQIQNININSDQPALDPLRIQPDKDFGWRNKH